MLAPAKATIPRPAFRNKVIGVACAARAADMVALLSHPPQDWSEATAIALYNAGLNSPAFTAPAVLMFVKGIPSAVSLPVSWLAWSKVNTGRVDPFLAKLTMAAN